MRCKPPFIIHVRAFQSITLTSYTIVQNEVPHLQSGCGTCIPSFYKNARLRSYCAIKIKQTRNK